MITPKTAKTMSTESLRYALKDLNEVIEIWDRADERGIATNPKLGVYFDERHAVIGELKVREVKLAKLRPLAI